MKQIKVNSKKRNEGSEEKRKSFFSFLWIFVTVVSGSSLLALVISETYYRPRDQKNDLTKEIILKQSDYLNTILDFTDKYNSAVVMQIRRYTKGIVRKHALMENGKFAGYIYDTIFSKGLDTSLVGKFPFFIADSENRHKFIEDISYIKENRHSIDHDVYSKFQILLNVLKKYPIPSNDTDLVHCCWNTKDVTTSWETARLDLRARVNEKLKIVQ